MSPARQPRGKIVLFGTLAALLLATAVGNFSFVSTIDKAYSDLISSETRFRAALRVIERESNAAQRSLLNILLTDDLAEISALRASALEGARRIDKQFARLSDLAKTPDGRHVLARLSTASLSYREACGSFLVSIEAGDRPAALTFYKSTMYPAFSTYQNVQEQAAAHVDAFVTHQSENVTRKTRDVGMLTVAISVLPFASGVITALFLIAFLIISVRARSLQNATE